MILLDVNVLVYAYREDAPEHRRYRDWLTATIGSDSPFGVADLVLAGFLRVVTHPRVFDPPTPLARALEFAETLRAQPNAMIVSPGRRHWEIFTRLCAEAGVKGNLVPDAYLAALAIESGSEWISTDRDYARFRDLAWGHPLDDRG